MNSGEQSGGEEMISVAKFDKLSAEYLDVLLEKEELLDAMEEVLRISDRKHDAWDKAKALINKYRKP